ncbi:hypothetical protein ACIP5Y_38860 [Nocardia sp. NPDC088792]|uniref:hypothetical protein n=1 Tax=Nocardia sp. NPDC088792 TaxID=3364332 RepID=UPI00381B02AA
MTLEEVATELYGVLPAQFVAARSERVREARESGDKTLAAAIGGLRRPTVAAWAVNVLAREAAEDVEGLLGLGEALREAQRRLSAEELRALSIRRQQVINALTRKVGELAAAHGQSLTEATRREIGSTLQAALAEPVVADQVRTGTLSTAASYEGFGPAALTAVPAARRTDSSETDSETAESTADSRPDGDIPDTEAPAPDPQQEARRELEDILSSIEFARTATTSAKSEHDSAATALAAAESRIDALRAELAHAQDQRRFAVAAERSTRDALRRTRRHLDDLERRAERIRNGLSPS